MKKLFSYLITIVVSIVAGFWLAETQILAGTWAGDALVSITQAIPAPESWRSNSNGTEIYNADDISSMYTLDVMDESQTAEDSSSDQSGEVDYELVEQRIFELLNELRVEQGLPELTYNEQLKKAADQRARETEELFSHTRPDGSEAFTVLKEPEYEYMYRLAGENLGMATYALDEEQMAELLFNGWVESEGHYKNMVHEGFEEVGIGVHYDGEMLYATQLFGTPL